MADYAVVAGESAACVGSRLDVPGFTQQAADGFLKVAQEESFFFHHFRAMRGIFPQGPAHLMEA